MTLVIDTSVTMAWCFEDEARPDCDAILDRLADEDARVPPMWTFEVANVLLVAERRGRISEAQSSRFLDLLSQLPIHSDPVSMDPATVVGAGRAHKLTAYDASYLLLAERIGAPLATLDARLAAAGRNAGLDMLIAV